MTQHTHDANGRGLRSAISGLIGGLGRGMWIASAALVLGAVLGMTPLAGGHIALLAFAVALGAGCSFTCHAIGEKSRPSHAEEKRRERGTREIANSLPPMSHLSAIEEDLAVTRFVAQLEAERGLSPGRQRVH